MKQIQASPSSLRVTSGSYLDMDRIQGFLTTPEQMGEVYLVQDPVGSLYLIRGHHEAFVHMQQRRPVVAYMVENDEDVTSLERGRARGATTLSELLGKCKAGNGTSKELGIEMVCDYLAIQLQQKLAAERRHPVV